MRQQVARTLAVIGIAAANSLVFSAGAVWAQATVSSDQTAGLLVYPRIVSDPNDIFGSGTATDTVIQLTNTDSVPHVVHCWIVNATGHCSSGVNVPGTVGAACRTASDCVGAGATCDPGWSAENFTVLLSPNMPLGWVASAGVSVPTPEGEGAVPPVTTIFFEGELKCLEVDGDSIVDSNQNPIDANDLQGAATIYTYDPVAGASLDIRDYNAIGIQAVTDGDTVDDQGDKTLCLGSNGMAPCATAEYAACPARLILDHYFEGATYQDGSTVSTSITFAPCTEHFDTNVTPRIPVQILVFNEFEQRFSAATAVECVTTISLADLGTIFDVSVQGTLTGQTSFRPVASGTAGAGVGLVAIAEEFISRVGLPQSSTAFQVNQAGMQEGVADVVSYVIP